MYKRGYSVKLPKVDFQETIEEFLWPVCGYRDFLKTRNASFIRPWPLSPHPLSVITYAMQRKARQEEIQVLDEDFRLCFCSNHYSYSHAPTAAAQITNQAAISMDAILQFSCYWPLSHLALQEKGPQYSTLRPWLHHCEYLLPHHLRILAFEAGGLLCLP